MPDSKLEERKLLLEIAFESFRGDPDSFRGDPDSFILGRLKDGDPESLPLELWNPALNPLVDIDRRRVFALPRPGRARLRESRVRPDREMCIAVVILGHDPSAVAVKSPEFAVAGRPLDEVLVPANRWQGQDGLELLVVHFPAHARLGTRAMPHARLRRIWFPRPDGLRFRYVGRESGGRGSAGTTTVAGRNAPSCGCV